MLKTEIEEVLKENDYKELEKLIDKLETAELQKTFCEMDKNTLLQILPKISPEYAYMIFLLLPEETQLFLVGELSYVEFKQIANELLDNDAENSLTETVFNEIILKAKTEDRNEKLVEIIDKLENKQFSTLKPLLIELEPVDIAQIFEQCDDSKIARLFRLLPKSLASDVFVEMNSDDQQLLITAFTDKELETIINDLFIDDTVDLIEDMPSNVVTRILSLSNSETRATINKLLGFPKDSAGSIMTTECVTLKENMTVYEALKKIRKQALDKETIYTCYVTDEQKKLLGIVTAKDLILHEPTDIISSFMDENLIYATTKTDKEEVSQLLSKYDMIAIPIVDKENRLNGIVTIDDAIDVIQEEAAEDLSKISGISAPSTTPYLQTSPFKLFTSRVPWLVILLLSSTFTGLIINIYESRLNSISTLLFACVPMIMGTGGNSGSQASVTIIQAISSDEISFKDIFRVLWKEIRVAFMVALVLAVTCFGKLQLIDRLIFGYPYGLIDSFVVSLSLFTTICIAKLVGALLPLLAKKLKLDPTVVANPFITTIIDVVSLLVFCGLSIGILG